MALLQISYKCHSREQTVSQLFFSVIPVKTGIQEVNEINVSGLSGQAGQ